MGAELLVWPMVAVGGIAAILFIAIFIQRFARAKHELRTSRREAELLPVFSAFINGDAGTAELRQAIGRSLPVAQGIIHGFLQELSGEGRERLLEAAEDIGFIDHAVRELRNPRWTRRDLAATHLGIYALPRTVPALVERLRDRRREVRFSAARSLGMIGSDEAVTALINILDRPELIDTPRVLEIVHAMQGQMSEPIRAMLESEEHPLEAKLLAIDLAGDLREHNTVDLLIQILRSSDKEKVVRSVKALGKISAPQCIERIMDLARDRAWEVRAQAIKAIGLLEVNEGIPLLIDGLSDSSYWVRRNAADALIRFGAEGYEALLKVRDSDDVFARDIAVYQLVRAGIATNDEPTTAEAAGVAPALSAGPLLPSGGTGK